MTVHTDAETAREFKLAAAILTAVAIAFAAVGIGAVALELPEEVRVAASSEPTPRPATTLPVVPAPSQDPNAPLVIKVRMDEFSFSPSRMSAPAGRLIRFEVVNSGVAPHEFLVGDEHAQEEAEREMAKGGAADGHSHGDTLSIYLDAGETGVLETTFEAPVELLVGCHVPGHWAAGMKGTLTVT